MLPGLAALGAAVAALSASPAGAATVVVNSHQVLNCCANGLPFNVSLGDLIQITPAGWIDAPPQSTGAFINLSPYTVDNAGRIRAYFGSEVQGLIIGGPATNLNSGLIEAASFSLLGSLVNTGTLITGAATNNAGQLVSLANEGPFAHIGAVASLENGAAGTVDVHGQMQVLGRLENVGTLRVLATGDSFLQVGGLGAPAVPPLFLNAGQASFADGTQLKNNAKVQNAGTLTLAFGASLTNAAGADFVNQAGGLLDLGGPGPMPPLAGTFIDNRGRFENQAGGVVQLRALTSFAASTGTLSNAGTLHAAGDLFDFSLENSGTLNLSGRMYRGTVVNSGNLTVQGGGSTFSMEVNNDIGGKVLVEAGGLLSSLLYSQEDQGVTVRGRLEWLDGILGSGNTLVPKVMLSVESGGQLAATPFTQPLLQSDGIIQNRGEILLVDQSRLQVAGEVRNAGLLRMLPGATLDLRPSSGQGLLTNEAGGTVLVQGQIVGTAAFPQERGGTVINRGEFRIAAGGAVGPVASGPVGDFLHEDGLLAIESGAVLNAKLLTMTGGVLKGTGRINGDVLIEGNTPPDPAVLLDCTLAGPGVACFKPGFSPGHMDIGGKLTMGQGSVLELELDLDAAGHLAWDSVTAGSMSFRDGALIRLLVGPDVQIAAALDLPLLNCLAGPCDFSGAQFDAPGLDNVQWQAGAGGLSVHLEVAAVPEPGTAWLWCAGLALVAGRRARRSGLFRAL